MVQPNDNWPTVAFVEVDRFCAECGYNLHQQSVMRQPETQLLVCRCPECGRFHAAGDTTSAGSLWVRRVGRLALVPWILGLLAAAAALAAAEGGLMVGTLEEMTHRQRITVSGTATQWTATIREMTDERYVVMTLLGSLSLAAGAILGTAAVTLCYHWRRRNYLLLVFLVPMLPAVLAGIGWRFEAPTMIGFGLKVIAGHYSLFVFGGIIGVCFGRPVSRAVIRAALPPKWWPLLGDLWTIDDKPLPKPRGSKLQSNVNQ